MIEDAAAETAESNETHARPIIPSEEELAKLLPDGGPVWNRLVFEQSPYLLQHAANPVDWRPWGDEAFEEARKQDKPVFLSIGYSTCHWCHVMERESFEDAEVAALLNEHFVCIKVDREERPDIDNVYMSVCIAATGSGGWPLTVVLTPDKKPFFTGTYFPKHSRFGRAGMLDLVPALSKKWREDRKGVETIVAQVESFLDSSAKGGAGERELTESTLETAFLQLRGQFDSTRGGFGGSRKFPTPHNLSFLLRYASRYGEKEAAEMVQKTLDEMRRGGIYDHVGFGFHRYSTDPDWLLPHFEKMLYDQALIAIAYVEAWQTFEDETYERTAREIFTYILRDMTSPEGGFYCAEDADSEGVEGRFRTLQHGLQHRPGRQLPRGSDRGDYRNQHPAFEEAVVRDRQRHEYG